MTATPTPEPTGVIHDIGYRHYDGPRLGRRPATVALALHSLRGVFGLGRPVRSKIMPFVLSGTMMLPAVVSIAMMAMVGERGVSYSVYASTMQPVLAIFLASQSPVLVAPDLRYRVLPLYLSRPVTVVDYVGAKLAAMTAALLLLIVTPLTVMYLGELLIDLPGPPYTGEFLASLASSVIYAVLFACMGVAVAALTPRRGIGVASVIALYLLASTIAEMLYAVLSANYDYTVAAWAELINPFYLVDAVQDWLFGNHSGPDHPDGSGPVAALGVVVLAAASIAVLIVRYRKAASS